MILDNDDEMTSARLEQENREALESISRIKDFSYLFIDNNILIIITITDIVIIIIINK